MGKAIKIKTIKLQTWNLKFIPTNYTLDTGYTIRHSQTVFSEICYIDFIALRYMNLYRKIINDDHEKGLISIILYI